MIPSTTHVREVSRVEHPSAWRADWQRRWDGRLACKSTTEQAVCVRWLLNELAKRIATCHESEINEVRAAARYAVGE